ncbi:MAG: LpxI family protein [Planctomycetaceae bacterium]|nr:LpxI family protein [Planctomycetaceae bacterium]
MAPIGRSHVTASNDLSNGAAALDDERVGRVGLFAGWGRYPVVIAETLREQGCEVYCLGVPNHADPRLAEICTDFRWCGMAKFGWASRYMRRHGVERATMAGKIFKHLLFQPFFILRQMPDFKTSRAFIHHFLTRRKDCKDDTLLGVVVELFASEGIHLCPATDFAPELLVKEGMLTRRPITPPEHLDIEFGWQVAKQMGKLDIGQSVAVKNQTVLAVEAVEGTDRCIQRAGELCRSGGFTVVKVAKPQQDMRFDVPTVGVQTLETMVGAGARVLAVEAERTIILDHPEVIDFANRHKLSIIAVHPVQVESARPAA